MGRLELHLVAALEAAFVGRLELHLLAALEATCLSGKPDPQYSNDVLQPI